MKMVLSALVALFAMFSPSSLFAAEPNNISLTTYYPAPFGAYDRFRLVPRPELTGSCENGSMYAREPEGTIQYCINGVWGSLPGPWIKQDNAGFDFRGNPADYYILNGTYSSTHKPFVGIGTNNPQNLLHLQTSDPGTPEMLWIENSAVRSGAYEETSPGPGANLSFRGTRAPSSTNYEYVTFRAVYEDQVDPKAHLRIYLQDGRNRGINQSEKVRILGTGLIGLRDTTPTAVLTIAGNRGDPGATNTDPLLRIGTNSGSDGDVLTVTSTGLVGINTTSPTQALDVNGSIKATALILSSDENLKKDIKPVNNALDKISQLRGVSFEWKNPDLDNSQAREHMGVIAQEVEKVFPEAVTGVDGAKAVDYSSLLAPLVEAVKELKTDHQILQQELTQQEQLLTEQAEVIRNLKSRMEPK